MNYIELKIHLTKDPSDEDILIAQLASIGFESFSQEDDYLLAYVPEKDFLKEKIYWLEGLKSKEENGQLSIQLIEDQNWNEVWENNYQAVNIGGRCLIRAPFHNSDTSVDYDIVLRPKMAFGTAHHETTALMIEMLLETDVERKDILDMGSGTAVLAILAHMKKASSVTAIDNDEWAYHNAVENAAINDAQEIKILLGDAALLGKDEYEVILANINKNILLRDMEAYSAALRTGGSIFFSGFYEQDLKDIKEQANKKGLIFVNYRTKNNWVAASFKKQ